MSTNAPSIAYRQLIWRKPVPALVWADRTLPSSEKFYVGLNFTQQGHGEEIVLSVTWASQGSQEVRLATILLTWQGQQVEDLKFRRSFLTEYSPSQPVFHDTRHAMHDQYNALISFTLKFGYVASQATLNKYTSGSSSYHSISKALEDIAKRRHVKIFFKNTHFLEAEPSLLIELSNYLMSPATPIPSNDLGKKPESLENSPAKGRSSLLQDSLKARNRKCASSSSDFEMKEEEDSLDSLRRSLQTTPSVELPNRGPESSTIKQLTDSLAVKDTEIARLKTENMRLTVQTRFKLQYQDESAELHRKLNDLNEQLAVKVCELEEMDKYRAQVKELQHEVASLKRKRED